MKIQILSDIHLEMNPCDIPVVGDVVVLAGDIHVGTQGIAWAKERFAGRPVVYLAGNHEFYGRVFPDLENLILDFHPTLWISGHTHYCSDYRIGSARMISNQRGYSDQDDTNGFRPRLVVDVCLEDIACRSEEAGDSRCC